MRANDIYKILVAVSLLAACKKYPDGPLISFKSKLARIAGIWDVESFEVNGIDSTSALKSKPFYGKYRFDKKGEQGEGEYASFITEDEIYSKRGFWEFKNKKNDLTIYLNDNIISNNSMGPYRAKLVTWEIRKLTENELWLNVIYQDGKDYLLKLKLYEDL